MICIGCAIVDVMIEGVDVVNGKVRANFQNGFHCIESISISTGGDALNEAIVLAKLGTKVKLMCGVGNDIPSEMIRNQAEKYGVDTSGIVYHPTSKTMLNVLLVQKDTEKYFFSEPYPSSTFISPTEEQLNGAKIVSLASLFTPPFDEADTVLKTLIAAKQVGAVTCADANFTPHTKLKVSEIIPALPYLDYFLPNEEEAYKITNKKAPEDMAETLLNYGIKNVIIKLGSKGCFFQNQSMSFYTPAFKVKSIDATGAGDSFMAGFISAILAGKPIDQCCRFASAVASLVVQAIGATTGVNSMEDVMQVLNS